MFEIDTKIKQEALNFAALVTALNMTEHRLDPQFNKLSRLIPVDIPMDSTDICKVYADFFHVEKKSLLHAYKTAYNSFGGLKETDEIIKRGSFEYPSLLAETQQAPRFLYIRGKKSLLYEKRTAALIGSRKASENAINNTKRLAVTLGKNGYTIISGLAKGIDAAAHKTALNNGFNTIAVIGTNLCQYYPAENKGLQMEIEEKGLIISQFPPCIKTQRWFFPLRNGVMSGLSLASVIMEAGETSGALKQADYAIKQGRHVIIPKNVMETKNLSWPQKYVQKGAVIAERPTDILKILEKINQNEEPKQQTLFHYIGGPAQD